mmetsp:Transcript_8358/g.23253  ORF Transcript_8358/g.23253 Transcript_8358/m.23253 type:complete len:216 (-) Transcript_8358:325-972(-)
MLTVFVVSSITGLAEGYNTSMHDPQGSSNGQHVLHTARPCRRKTVTPRDKDEQCRLRLLAPHEEDIRQRLQHCVTHPVLHVHVQVRRVQDLCCVLQGDDETESPDHRVCGLATHLHVEGKQNGGTDEHDRVQWEHVPLLHAELRATFLFREKSKIENYWFPQVGIASRHHEVPDVGTNILFHTTFIGLRPRSIGWQGHCKCFARRGIRVQCARWR